jgi:hypothetical protein
MTKGFTSNSLGVKFLWSLFRGATTGHSGAIGALSRLNQKLYIKNSKGLLSKGWNLINRGTTLGLDTITKAAAKNRALRNYGKTTTESILENSSKGATESAAEAAERQTADKILEAGEKDMAKGGTKASSRIVNFFNKLSENPIVKKFLKKVLKSQGRSYRAGC